MEINSNEAENELFSINMEENENNDAAVNKDTEELPFSDNYIEYNNADHIMNINAMTCSTSQQPLII